MMSFSQSNPARVMGLLLMELLRSLRVRGTGDLGLIFGLIDIAAIAEGCRWRGPRWRVQMALLLLSPHVLPIASFIMGMNGRHHKPLYSSPPSLSIPDAYPRTIESGVSIPLVSR
jgi:hypothetical protein